MTRGKARGPKFRVDPWGGGIRPRDIWGVEPKNRGTPKMDGENNGKP